ncbi:hypothetical protein Fmac_026874 [Flemingia macrophylla]|uniref:Uncharacterized protein n=1 Tax=Flemingia macrophylla TaxID=520843 RepID=A0ABD1LG30_9FABA
MINTKSPKKNQTLREMKNAETGGFNFKTKRMREKRIRREEEVGDLGLFWGDSVKNKREKLKTRFGHHS